MTRWTKPIATKELREFPGYYIDTAGKLWTEWGKGSWSKSGCRRGNRKLMSPSTSCKGYLHTAVRREGVKKNITLHRLVCLEFVPNPSSKPEINHINGDKADNCVRNLEWVTSKENCAHNMHALGVDQARGNRCPVAAYDCQTGELVQTYDSIYSTRLDGYDYASVARVLRGERKKYRGLLWRRV